MKSGKGIRSAWKAGSGAGEERSPLDTKASFSMPGEEIKLTSVSMQVFGGDFLELEDTEAQEEAAAEAARKAKEEASQRAKKVIKVRHGEVSSPTHSKENHRADITRHPIDR